MWSSWIMTSYREKMFFLFKWGHIIYCWKGLVTLIQNYIRTRVWKWSPHKIFTFEIGHVTNFKLRYLARTSFSCPGSYVILNHRNTSFQTVYRIVVQITSHLSCKYIPYLHWSANNLFALQCKYEIYFHFNDLLICTKMR